MQKLVEQSELIYCDVVEKAATIESLWEKRDKLEKENETKVRTLDELREKGKYLEEQRNILSSRNETMREKLDKLETSLREDGARTTENMKYFFSLLGINFKAEPSPDNLIDLKISFKQDRNQFATLVYDPKTEDYDLTSLHPEHPQFRNLREFLRETKDIQGFLFTFRCKVLNHSFKLNKA